MGEGGGGAGSSGRSRPRAKGEGGGFDLLALLAFLPSIIYSFCYPKLGGHSPVPSPGLTTGKGLVSCTGRDK